MNGFDRIKFYEICEGITDNLCVIKTEIGKIFGAYSHLPYKKIED